MNLTIQNASPALTADLAVLGAAVKIIMAGGAALDAEKMKRASGASRYLWEQRGPEIIELVKMLDREDA